MACLTSTFVFSLLSFLKRKRIELKDETLCVFICQLLNHSADFYKIWSVLYAIAGHPKAIPFNFLYSVITTWPTRKLVMWGRQQRHFRALK
jgi:hypothetical protein